MPIMHIKDLHMVISKVNLNKIRAFITHTESSMIMYRTYSINN